MTRRDGERGVVSLEVALMLPVLFLAVLVALHGLVVARAVLLAHESARAGARVAATTTSLRPVLAAAREAAEGRETQIVVNPPVRAPGDLGRVTVTIRDRAGPFTFTATAAAVARVEPGAAG